MDEKEEERTAHLSIGAAAAEATGLSRRKAAMAAAISVARAGGGRERERRRAKVGSVEPGRFDLTRSNLDAWTHWSRDLFVNGQIVWVKFKTKFK
jgi:hypothetical protein